MVKQKLNAPVDITVAVVRVLKKLESAELQRIQSHLRTKPSIALDRPEQ